MTNLRLAFPRLTGSQLKSIERKALWNLIRVYMEIPLLQHMSSKRLLRYCRFENADVLRRGATHETGALLLSGHVGNWELLAIAAGVVAEEAVDVVVKSQNDYGHMNRVRTAHGNRTIPTHKAARGASAVLTHGGLVAMLADQSAGTREPLIDFFGIPTYAFSAPARLALRFRPDIVVGFAVRSSRGRYSVHLHNIDASDLPESPDSVRELVQRYHKALEQVISKHPEQWVWHHKRWKNSPGITYD